MNINRDYLIINDVKKSNIKLDNGSIFFYITDKNTQNIFVNLVINVSNNDLIQKYANIENAEDYTLTMNIVKPSNTYKVIEGKLHDKENAIFEFNLNEDCCDEIGTYRCELLTKCNINDHEEITTSNKLTYKVKSSVLNDLDDIVEAPEYPLVIQLFDKLSDIEQYEEDRRANELARQLAEEQRQTRFDALEADMTDSIEAIDNKVIDVENRVSAKEEAVDKLIVDTKADIDDYKVAKDQEIDDYKTAKDTEINNAITNQDNKIDTSISEQNDRITLVESNDAVQDDRLNAVETKNQQQDGRLDAIEVKNQQQDSRLDIVENKNQQQDNRLDTAEAKNVEQDNKLNEIEAIDVAQNSRLDAIEVKNQQQDDRLLDIEKTNKRQDMNLKCLFAESKNNMIDIAEEGNSIFLQNSTIGYTLIDEIKGNTLVNCNKEPNKELILNGNINTSGDNNVTITEGVDGGLVDVALEGNTLVNVSKTKDSTAISIAYTVENSGNHIALQGEVDGSCRPVIAGNTLWVDNNTEEVLTAFDKTKNLRLQSTFEDNLVTQEMVDSGEEVADNLDKYKVEYKVTGKNLLDQSKGVINAGLNSKTICIKVKPNTSYAYSSSNYKGRITVYELPYKVSNGSGISEVQNITLKQHSIVDRQTFTTGSFTNYILMNYDKDSDVQLEEGNTATSYELYKEYTKILYLNSPLLEGDTIEEKDGGIYHVHRYTKAVLDGNKTYKMGNDGVDSNGVPLFNTTLDNSKGSGRCLCDTLIARRDIAGDKIAASTTNLGIMITGSGGLRIKTGSLSVNDLVVYFTENPAKVVYELKTPTYELIEQSNLVIPSYTNGHLDFNTAVPVEKVDFLPFTEELAYLYANTQYTVQFVSDKATTADITLGGTQLLTQNIVAGLNRIAITTPATLVDNKLIISGVGANISKVVVTDTDREFKYFEGMKSVGEGGNLVITSSNSDNSQSNTQQLTHEPLRAVGDAKDRYVLIDGKWYIERRCGGYTFTGNENWRVDASGSDIQAFITNSVPGVAPSTTNIISNIYPKKQTRLSTKEVGFDTGSNNALMIYLLKSDASTVEELRNYLSKNEVSIAYELQTPQYEPIDYNPLEVYSGTTRITTNSTIPTNIIVKNHGFNCLLKPSTTYTISSNLGLNTVTTPSTLTEDCLRFMDTDTSDITTMKNVLVLEGDWTTKANLIPANFSGIESAFEQEYDAEKGKYKVNVKVANEDKSKENNITFYINEPLKGVGDSKDRIFIKDDKVVVQRNCASVTFDGSERWIDNWNNAFGIEKHHIFHTKINGKRKALGICNIFTDGNLKPLKGECIMFTDGGEDELGINIKTLRLSSNNINGFKQWLQQNPVTIIYQLAEPTYEEVEYNDTEFFIESFKNSTLSYNSNVPVTSKLYYSYSVPIVDTVAQTANVTDQQDSMIIDLATSVAVMEMMLM